MAFADEPVGYHARRFLCGWGARQQTGAEIADRLQQLERGFGKLDSEFGRIRPDPGMRRFRPGDRGPIVDMPLAELAELIERRGRFDLPKFPAPVGPIGYSLLYRNDVTGSDPGFLSVALDVGRHATGDLENQIDVRPDTEHPLWRDLGKGLEILDTLVEAWDPEWAHAYASVGVSTSETDERMERIRPWLAWTAQPREPGPNPPYSRPYPVPNLLVDAGPPAEVRAWRGGELQIWP